MERVYIEPITWDRIDFGVTRLYAADGEPGVPVPVRETREAIKTIAKMHFPDGPESAVEASAAHDAWWSSCVVMLFTPEHRKPQLPELAKPWEALVQAWKKFHSSEQYQHNRMHGAVNVPRGRDLKKQVSKIRNIGQSSWRDRRPKHELARAADRRKGGATR